MRKCHMAISKRPKKNQAKWKNPRKKPLTLDHESDIMNTQQRKENLPNQKGLTP